MKIISFIVSLVLAPLYALSQAAALSVVWGWFLAPQYGKGPSYAAWYGASVIITLLGVLRATIQTKSDEKNELGPAMTYVVAAGVLWLCVGLAWCTGSVIGWI